MAEKASQPDHLGSRTVSERTDSGLPCPKTATRRRSRWPLGACREAKFGRFDGFKTTKLGLSSAVSVSVGVALGLAACAAPTPSVSATTAPLSTSTSVSAAPGTSSAAPSTAALARLPSGAVLAVKIDNTAASRPRIGIDKAAVVYVEPVEGGLTRLLAVFSTGAGALPGEVGPIRSARESDVT